MTKPSKQVNSNAQVDRGAEKNILTLFLGETYAELEVFQTSKTSKTKTQSLQKKTFFLPQTTLKTALNQFKKILLEKEIEIHEVLIVCRYLERLKTFRLGGSVIQLVHVGFENSYVVENTSKVSLAANALTIPIPKDITLETLNTEYQRIKKINPDANKVVFEINPDKLKPEQYQLCLDFFKKLDFKIFECPTPESLISIRHQLLNAGSEGTKEEILSELKESFPTAEIYFWTHNSYKKADSGEYQNTDLYFSSLDFLNFHRGKIGKKHLVHFDLENWMILTNTEKKIWNSPWGKVQRTHLNPIYIALHPLTEILIDETARLQFSKNPASSEPGPMIAGRGVKSLLIDLFYDDFLNIETFQNLFPNLQTPLLQKKIESQFKVLEKGQNSPSVSLSQIQLKEFVRELIQFELELYLEQNITDDSNIEWTGHCSFLFQKSKSTKPLAHFSWTEAMIRYRTL